MTPDDFPTSVKELCDTCRLFGERGWCRATSGNFSVRVDASHCMITRSGRDKSGLSTDDLMICDLHGKALDSACQASAETPLHTLLYGLDANIGAVLHTHSVTATILSRAAGASIDISGFEMQKAMAGVSSHEETLAVQVFDNNQDMTALAAQAERAWHASNLDAHGFLIRGHGLYAWGSDIAEARRHIEGLEFLISCLWREKSASLQ